MHEDSKALLNRLIRALGPEEGRAVFQEICRELFPGKAAVSIFPETISASEWEKLDKLVSGIESEIPLQYLLEKAHFMGFELMVNPSVLIPRPETEELVSLVLENRNLENKSLLDLCTGSGCIALALSLKGNFKSIDGLDVSTGALETARINAEKLGALVSFFAFDLLCDSLPEGASWDVWISNPPYVAGSEAAQMDARVLQHEPHLALFVPDEDALMFYRRILDLSEKHLNPDGEIFLEINPVYAEELALLFKSKDWVGSAEILKDMSGKQRFLHARKS